MWTISLSPHTHWKVDKLFIPPIAQARKLQQRQKPLPLVLWLGDGEAHL